jgi:hypothetical protein
MRCEKTTLRGDVQCHGTAGHEGPCFIGGVVLADFDQAEVARELDAALRDRAGVGSLLRALPHCDGCQNGPVATRVTKEGLRICDSDSHHGSGYADLQYARLVRVLSAKLDGSLSPTRKEEP